MDPEITRDNHYIAQWYQRGFLAPSQVQLQYLDMMPDQKALDGGRIVTMKALTQRGPKACFYQTDLYSTRFGSVVSDETTGGDASEPSEVRRAVHSSRAGVTKSASAGNLPAF